jgi:hypothetical protein
MASSSSALAWPSFSSRACCFGRRSASSATARSCWCTPSPPPCCAEPAARMRRPASPFSSRSTRSWGLPTRVRWPAARLAIPSGSRARIAGGATYLVLFVLCPGMAVFPVVRCARACACACARRPSSPQLAGVVVTGRPFRWRSRLVCRARCRVSCARVPHPASPLMRAGRRAVEPANSRQCHRSTRHELGIRVLCVQRGAAQAGAPRFAPCLRPDGQDRLTPRATAGRPALPLRHPQRPELCVRSPPPQALPRQVRSRGVRGTTACVLAPR